MKSHNVHKSSVSRRDKFTPHQLQFFAPPALPWYHVRWRTWVATAVLLFFFGSITTSLAAMVYPAPSTTIAALRHTPLPKPVSAAPTVAVRQTPLLQRVPAPTPPKPVPAPTLAASHPVAKAAPAPPPAPKHEIWDRDIAAHPAEGNYRRAYTMLVTAYTPINSRMEGGRYTAVLRDGRSAHGVAVDPRLIRLGSQLWIPGYGHAVADDTGGRIRGHHVDLRVQNYGMMSRWGTRRIRIYVISDP